MKKSLIVLVLSTLALTACSEKDKEYYLSNIDVAKEKVQQCKAALNTALMLKNEAKFTEVAESKECKAAELALREYERKNGSGIIIKNPFE